MPQPFEVACSARPKGRSPVGGTKLVSQVSGFTWTVPVHTCGPSVTINSGPFHSQSVPVWTMKYVLVLRMGGVQEGVRGGQGPQWPGRGVPGSDLNGILRQDWECGERDGLSPRRSPRTVRLYHLPEGAASVEAKGTDCIRQPRFQS